MPRAFIPITHIRPDIGYRQRKFIRVSKIKHVVDLNANDGCLVMLEDGIEVHVSEPFEYFSKYLDD
jgi:hypothetical protein